MDPFKLLRQQAAENRDKALKSARAEYRIAIREINALKRRMRKRPTTRSRSATTHLRPLRNDIDGYRSMPAITAADTVLRELGPRTLVELTLEVQRRGCRASDDPRSVANSIRSSFYYHKDRFSCDGAGRWSSVAKD